LTSAGHLPGKIVLMACHLHLRGRQDRIEDRDLSVSNPIDRYQILTDRAI
jgi:hypothetical protein